jgi:hypothetical protein
MKIIMLRRGIVFKAMFKEKVPMYLDKCGGLV